MNSFYSIVSISPNSSNYERLSLGIIASNGKELFFLSSKRKKNLIDKLLTTDKAILDFVLKELETKIEHTNQINKAREKDLFQLGQLLDGEYFNYLKNYSNGLLHFSSPNYLASEVGSKEVIKLFQLYVDPFEVKTKKSPKVSDNQFRSRVKQNLTSKVKDRVHTNFSIDSTAVQTIGSPFQLDCVGKNGSLISAKALPFSSSIQTLSKEINTYISVMSHLSRKYSNLTDDQFYLIADEPTQKSSDQFKYLKNLKKDKMLNIISSNDAEEVAFEIERKGAQTFLKV